MLQKYKNIGTKIKMLKKAPRFKIIIKYVSHRVEHFRFYKVNLCYYFYRIQSVYVQSHYELENIDCKENKVIVWNCGLTFSIHW
jgi:hypothetical protein